MKLNNHSRVAARLRLAAFVVVAAALCLTSCSDDYAKVLPADCSAVVKVNTKSVIKKAKLDKNDGLRDLTDKIRDEAEKNFSRTSRELLEEILDDPSKAGIDLRRSLYFFAPSKSFPYGGMVAKVSDEDDLESTLEMLLKESEAGKLKEYDECKLATIDDGRAAVAFDGSTLLVAAAVERHDGRIARDIRKRFSEKGESSAFDSEAFKEIAARDDDMSACIVMENVLKMLPIDEREDIRNICKATNLKDWSVIAGLNFGDELVELYVEPLPGSDKAREELKRSNEIFPAVQGKFLAQLADDIFFVAGGGFNGKKYGDYISKLDVVKHELEKQPELVDMVRRAMCAVNGEWAMGVAAPQEGEPQRPQVCGFADIGGKTAVEGLLNDAMARFGTQTRWAYNEDYEYFGGNMYEEKTFEVMTHNTSDGTYRYDFSPGSETPEVLTMAVSDKTFGFSMRPKFSLTDKPSRSLASADYADRVKGNAVFAVFDFRTLGKNADVRKELSRAGLEDYFDKLETAEMYLNGNMRYTVSLRFRDLGKKETPLTLLADLLSDVARKS